MSDRARTRFEESRGKEHWLVEDCVTGRLKLLNRKFDFTPRLINELPYCGPSTEDGKRRTQRFHWDVRCRWLLLVVGLKTKTFFYEGKPRVKLGQFGDITVKEAREAALKVRVEQRSDGLNHNDIKRKARARKEAEKALTLRVAFDEMVAEKEAHGKLKPRTIKQYKHLLEKNLKDWLDKPLTRITGTMTRKRLTEIRNRAKKNKRKDARGNVADYTMRVLSSVFSFAQGHDEHGKIVTENPTKAVRKLTLKTVSLRDQIVADADLAAFFKAVEGLRRRPQTKGYPTARPVAADLIETMLFTGMRSGEARRLRWDRNKRGSGVVDLAARCITVTDTKNGETLELPITDHLITILESSAPRKTGWVFPSVRGGPIMDVAHYVDEVREAAKLRILKPHTLRHTFATIAGGVADYPVLVALLNHKAADVTSKHYAGVTWARKLAAMDAVANHLLKYKAESQGLKLAGGGGA